MAAGFAPRQLDVSDRAESVDRPIANGEIAGRGRRHHRIRGPLRLRRQNCDRESSVSFRIEKIHRAVATEPATAVEIGLRGWSLLPGSRRGVGFTDWDHHEPISTGAARTA